MMNFRGDDCKHWVLKSAYASMYVAEIFGKSFWEYSVKQIVNK